MQTATKNDVDRKILEICTRKGINPSHMNEALYRRLALAAYSELGSGGKAITSATTSVARVALGFRVTKQVARENRSTCVGCPHGMFDKLGSGQELCRACGCSGKLLEYKWRDGKAHCPLTIHGNRCDFAGDYSPDDPSDPPVWDNRNKKVTRDQETPPDRDLEKERCA